MGNGKDKCNFFAVKAWKPIAKSTVSILGGSSKSGSGWVSEIHGRFGVITFCGSNNLDERIYFTADKLFLYEKKLSAKQTLTGLLTVGDQISFDFEYVENGTQMLIVDCYLTALYCAVHTIVVVFLLFQNLIDQKCFIIVRTIQLWVSISIFQSIL